MLGHIGVNAPDLRAAKTYYDAIMPLVGFEPFLEADDEFAYRPMSGKPGTYLFFYAAMERRVLHEPQHFPQYPQPYLATFWLDPFGFMLEAVCHHDRE